jgi:hypothetical protein
LVAQQTQLLHSWFMRSGQFSQSIRPTEVL